ncbi:UNVERIFIED_ORG: response regulator [Bacillus sp. AZ43]
MSQPHPHPPVRTALVVDDSAGARRRITMLLQLGGWRVHQAVGTDAALRVAAVVEPDLVVTDMAMRNGHGATLMRRLRQNGSRAAFVVVSARRTHQVRALAAGAGAVACLAKPVDPRLFVDVLRGLAAALPRPADEPVAPAEHRPAAPPPGRAEEMYASALPHWLTAIADSARAGDAEAVASAAVDLATVSARVGHVQLAFACHAVADDARRGVLPQSRLMELVELCARVEGSRFAQATSR